MTTVTDISNAVTSAQTVLNTLSNQLAKDHSSEVVSSVWMLAQALGQVSSAVLGLTLGSAAIWSSYTPTLVPSSGSITTATTVGRWTQTGSTVLVVANWVVTDPGTATSAIAEVGLPVAAASGNLQGLYGLVLSNIVFGRIHSSNTGTTGAARILSYNGLSPTVGTTLNASLPDSIMGSYEVG